MNQIFVKRADLTDIEVLVPLFDSYREFYGRNSDLEAARAFLTARLENNESVIFIARESETPVGFTQLYPSFSSVSLAPTFILNDLFVTLESRKQGVGSLLLSAAVDYAKTRNAIRLTLSTEVTNETAQALYESTGWIRTEQYYTYDFTV
ncbi:GNAT family N-acetyltransferase [uncultured Gimesia sp.]|uniref:GNAT family N-acetyltransferase n=1 Tax=uncultured Gimesia sp. TaxID=1678688 RepID=UPI002637B516|nr:GNAT family N-acetyltransferase [uncultured Gimesia sp.]